jgi:PhnB protein
VAAGASVRMPLEDAFWGDRWGMVTDPFGHVWAIATRKKNLSVPR